MRRCKGRVDSTGAKNQMVFPVLLGNAAFGEHSAGLGNPFYMHCLGVTTNQMMPERQILALGHQTVSAGGWKPLELGRIRGIQLNAIRHAGTPVGIVAAPAGLQIEQLAGNACVIDGAVFLVFEFLQAAEPATVAQRFPFDGAELGKGLAYPEGFDFGRHVSVTTGKTGKSSHCRISGQ